MGDFIPGADPPIKNDGVDDSQQLSIEVLEKVSYYNRV